MQWNAGNSCLLSKLAAKKSQQSHLTNYGNLSIICKVWSLFEHTSNIDFHDFPCNKTITFTIILTAGSFIIINFCYSPSRVRAYPQTAGITFICPSSLIMLTFLIRSATSQSSSYPIILTRLGGPCSRLNPHLKLWKCRELNSQPHDKKSDMLTPRPMRRSVMKYNQPLM